MSPHGRVSPYGWLVHVLTDIFLYGYIQGVVTVFEVVAEPHRRQVLDLLRSAERPVGDLVAELGLSQPAVSKHLRILREAGLVAVRGDAQRRLYRVRPEPLRGLDEWLAPYRQMWQSRLDDLERHLDEMENEDDDDSPQGTRPSRNA